MSPWVCLNSRTPSYLSDTPLELFSTAKITEYGATVLSRIEDPSYLPYIEPVNVPDRWFERMGDVVGRVLMTAGEGELFRDDIVKLSRTLSALPSREVMKPKENGENCGKIDFRLVLQKDGIHNDPIVDFVVGLPEKQLGSVTKVVVEWLKDGIAPDR